MKRYSKKEIVSSLSKSIDTLTDNKKDYESNINIEEESYMDKKIKKNFMPVLAMTLIFAFLIVGFSGNYYNKNLAVKTEVTLDVNPSVKLSTNYYDKVIKVEALNDDGEVILENIDVDGLSPVEATNIIIDELISEGYLATDGANVLLTIQNNDLDKAAEIEQELLVSVNEKLDTEYIAGTVLTQTDTLKKNIDEDTEAIMNQYQISYSKAMFIKNVVEQDDTLEVSDLAGLKMNEISAKINENGIDITTIVGHNGTDSMYESKAVVNSKKAVDEAVMEQSKANEEVKSAEASLNAKKANNEDATEEQKAYEEALMKKEQSDNSVDAAQNTFEESVQLSNQGDTTQNAVSNQASNGSETSTGNSDTTTSSQGNASVANTPAANQSSDTNSENSNSTTNGNN